MESCDFVHSVKSEKAHALARYRLFTNIVKAVQLMEVFVVVILMSWSSTRLPSLFKFSSEYLLALASYLMNQHVVFLVGNVIVFVCYVLSRNTDSGNEFSGSHFDYSHDDQLTVRKTVYDFPNNKLITLQVTESPSEKAVTAIKQAAKQIERFRRTQSDLKREISVKPHRELRRSVTERRSMTGESFPAVDKLSNEEFRIAVEKFISKQQMFLKQQCMVEDDS
ncbi:hypothetical protein L1987_23249 [Smallanthus sonchifolius]|uniref:Uncharacterized protein n=1 Tax=Smallanthus sonchifolius TaxID=185202 RepID=A0ACB9IGE5_9ASTR|nr:hypothetical protein L1987_23249 [Smallanthus sonchifolius]